MGYQQKTLIGFSSHTFFKVFTSAIVLVKLFFLARILTPTDFGLFSLTTIALGISEAMTETGVNYTIIQSKRPLTYFLNTAWVIAILRGLLIGVVMLLLGVLMQSFYGDQSLLLLVGLASIIPVIKGFINPAIISMQKELAFVPDSAYRISLVVIETTLAIALAWWTSSVFALIWAMIGAAFFEVLISFVFFRVRPHFEFIKSRAITILHNAKWLSLSAIFSYLQENADNFLIGKIVGTTSLGLYHNAYALSHKSYELARAAHHATLPIYVRINNDKQRLQKGYLKTLFSIGGLMILAAIPFFVVPDLIVRIVLGDQWLAIIPVLPYLSLAVILHAFATLTYTLFLSQQKYRVMNTHLFITTLLMIGLILVLTPNWGLIGAGVAVLAARLLTAPILIFGIISSFKNDR